MVGGNGSVKLKNILAGKDFIYGSLNYNINDMVIFSLKAYAVKNFANLAYSEPFYIKPAYVK